MRKIAPLLFAVVFAVSACAPAAAKSVTLAHSFKKGQVDKYRMSMDVKMSCPMLPPEMRQMSVKMSCNVTQKVLEVLQDGSARIRSTCDRFKVDVPGADAGKMEDIPQQSVTYTMSTNGQVLEVSDFGGQGLPGGFDPGQMASSMSQYAVFPSGPIDLGTSWQCSVPLPFGTSTMDMLSTLEAAAVPVSNDVGSKIKQSFTASVDLGEMMNGVAAAFGGAMPQINGTIDVTGWNVFYFSLTQGNVIKSNGSFNMDMLMQMPPEAVQQGAPGQINMNMVMSINLART